MLTSEKSIFLQTVVACMFSYQPFLRVKLLSMQFAFMIQRQQGKAAEIWFRVGVLNQKEIFSLLTNRSRWLLSLAVTSPQHDNSSVSQRRCIIRRISERLKLARPRRHLSATRDIRKINKKTVLKELSCFYGATFQCGSRWFFPLRSIDLNFNCILIAH